MRGHEKKQEKQRCLLLLSLKLILKAHKRLSCLTTLLLS